MTHLPNFTFKNQNHLVLSSKSVKNQHISYRFKIELTYSSNFRKEKCLMKFLQGHWLKKELGIETQPLFTGVWFKHCYFNSCSLSLKMQNCFVMLSLTLTKIIFYQLNRIKIYDNVEKKVLRHCLQEQTI